jgi:hypothetical protein
MQAQNQKGSSEAEFQKQSLGAGFERFGLPVPVRLRMKIAPSHTVRVFQAAKIPLTPGPCPFTVPVWIGPLAELLRPSEGAIASMRRYGIAWRSGRTAYLMALGRAMSL